jgi:hypothetical protein
MAKLNKNIGRERVTPTVGKSPIKVTDKRVRNFEGADASMYGKKAQLFQVATNTFSGEDTYYSKAATRDAELKKLVELVALKDPEWMARFLPWLRGTANIRTSSITIAIDTAAVWLKAGIPGGRGLVKSVLQRADEPAEALAYAMSVFGARRIPKPVKRGIADAASRLYSEYALLNYDSDSNAIRFGDVLELTHPAPSTPAQIPLFKYAIDVRHGRPVDAQLQAAQLPMLAKNRIMRYLWNSPDFEASWLDTSFASALKEAGMDWRAVLSALGSKVDKAKLWEALIPNMGYMALLRNLRNMEQAGISKDAIRAVCNRLADPVEVAKSKQLPMRFLSAYRNTVSDAFKYAIGEALEASLGNIPKLTGKTLILIDTSGSMNSNMSDKSGLKRWDAAVIFGIALARSCEDAEIVSFSDAQIGYSHWSGRTCTGEPSKLFPEVRGESLLRGISRWESGGFFLGAGTDTAGAVNRHFRDHKRIIILTDEQAQGTGDPYARIPADVVKIDVNLAGYGHSHAPATTPNLIKLAGLTDSMFTMIPWLEAGLDESWPF